MAEKKEKIINSASDEGVSKESDARNQNDCEETQGEERALDGDIKSLQDALEKANSERDEYLRIAQRTQADFMNYKRHNASARTDAYDEGVRDALSALLPTVDNLERAIDAAQKTGSLESLTEGVGMTLKQMLAAMEKLGMSEIPASGEVFDPECHNAVVCTPGGEPGTVQEVFQKGYRAKGRILRCAMVRVAAE